MTHRLSRVAVAALAVLAAACRDNPTRQSGPPAAITAVTTPSATATVGTSAGNFAVKVTDASGVGVSDATVVFSVTGGGIATPEAAGTDGTGVATATVTAGTSAGSQLVTATVSGTNLSTTASITAVAGPLARIVLVPDVVRLGAVGDTVRLVASGFDAYDNPVPTGTISFLSLDPTAVSVNALGTARAEKMDAAAGIVASNGTRADTTVVSVVNPAASPCTGLATQRTLAVGEVVTFNAVSKGCVAGTATGADFAMIVYNGDTLQARSTTVSTVGSGTPPLALDFAATPTLGYRGISASAAALQPDAAFHDRLRRQALALESRMPAAQEWHRLRQATASATTAPTAGVLSPGGVSRSTIPSNPQVGDIFSVNVDVNGDCTTKDYRNVRVVAIGTRSIVMADTANPSGGFTTADYQRFAATFDTLVYPLDVGAFGVPTDMDNNGGKVGILFTRAVNEYTAPGSSSFVAGFFAERDLFPKVGTARLDQCPTSNEAELFYMLAPDPTGAVNGNVRTTALVAGFTISTIAHEFQHLINAGRRLYVNNASVMETVWLNEGLSHIAEELLYYRRTKKGPRQNLGDAEIRVASSADYDIWKEDMSQNFQRYANWLSNPPASSPRGANDDVDDALSTRGATWAFLRYAADRLYPTDGDVWFKLVNSTGRGLTTLRTGFNNDPVGLIRDWTVASYLDDTGVSTDPKYQQLSWNFRNIYTTTFVAGTYPLKVTALASGASAFTSIQRSSASYFRFSAPPGSEALINFSNTGGAPNARLQFLVVRTR